MTIVELLLDEAERILKIAQRQLRQAKEILGHV